MALFPKSITLRRQLTLSQEEFVQLRDFIYSQSGIFVAENRKYLLENRLANRVKELNLNTFMEYLSFLKYDPGRRNEMSRLFEAVTTNETSFYRNPPQLKIFQERVLPELVTRLRERKERRLRIWSAGCSTGEEPYTLAMIVHEVLGSELPQWDVKITANDLSEAVIATARRGTYSEYTLRTTPRNILERYFVKEDSGGSSGERSEGSGESAGTSSGESRGRGKGSGRHKLRPEVKRLVSLGTINLSDKYLLKRVEQSHIVFCRNVIIYFDEAMKKQVISGFYDNLLPNGYLFIGHSESLHNISRAFKPLHFSGSIVYRRGE
jgi:chemotaxis protein methyltransferase CheR